MHEVSTLCRRTEGWAAALRLAALSLRDHPEPEAHVAALAASDRTVADYLLEELLDRQPADLRAFLLRTSIVDDLTGDLADALTEGSDGAARLADLVRRNAMVTRSPAPADGSPITRCCATCCGPSWVPSGPTSGEPSIAARHRGWPTNGREREALGHARAADDPDLVARIVRDRWTELVVEGELGTLCELVDRVPPKRLAAEPEIALAGVVGHLAASRLSRAEELLGLADAALRTHPDARLAGLHAAARLYDRRLRGADFVTELQTLRELARAPHDDPEVQALMLVSLGVGELWAAPHGEAIEALEAAVAAAVAVRRPFLQIVAGGHLALALAFDGRMRQAAERAEEVIGLAARTGADADPSCAPAHLALAAARREWLDGAGAERALDLAETALRDSPERALHLAFALERSRVLLDSGQPSAAATALRVGDFRLGGHPVPSALRTSAARARRAGPPRLGRGRGGARGARAERRARARGRPRAHPAARAGSGGRARVPVGQRADRCARDRARRGRDAASGGPRRPPRTRRRGGRHRASAGAPPSATTCGAACSAPGHGCSPSSIATRAAPRRMLRSRPSSSGCWRAERPGARSRSCCPTSLTERELAILRYLPTIMSNREIARQLYVSVNTVKTHLKQIYRKLGVASRRDAIARARELHLLGPSTRLRDAA